VLLAGCEAHVVIGHRPRWTCAEEFGVKVVSGFRVATRLTQQTAALPLITNVGSGWLRVPQDLRSND
jgi:hypothetical protein